MDFVRGKLEAGKEKAIAAMEEKFHEEINEALSKRITPIYNVFMLIFAAVFAYFCFNEDELPDCYAKGEKAYQVEYSGYENISHQFHMMHWAGAALLLLSALMFHI